MQVAEKPKTVCVKCKWYQPFRVATWRNTIIPVAQQCTIRNNVVHDTVTGAEFNHNKPPEHKNDGNCQDYEEK